MIRVHCSRHGQDVLLSQRRIVGIDGSGPDMTVRWVCYCGHRGSHQPHHTESAPVRQTVAA